MSQFLKVQPSVVDFGSVAVGRSHAKELSVQNPFGHRIELLLSASATDRYLFNPRKVVIEPNKHAVVIVTLSLPNAPPQKRQAGGSKLVTSFRDSIYLKSELFQQRILAKFDLSTAPASSRHKVTTRRTESKHPDIDTSQVIAEDRLRYSVTSLGQKSPLVVSPRPDSPEHRRGSDILEGPVSPLVFGHPHVARQQQDITPYNAYEAVDGKGPASPKSIDVRHRFHNPFFFFSNVYSPFIDNYIYCSAHYCRCCCCC